jgi:hypothetical protein
MRSVTIDILNDKVIKLLKELESLNLIKVRSSKKAGSRNDEWINKYKGSISKQPTDDIDKQLNEIRDEW